MANRTFNRTIRASAPETMMRLPENALPIFVRSDDSKDVKMWFVGDAATKPTDRVFCIVEDGVDLPDVPHEYIGTVSGLNGARHVFERKEAA